MQFKSLFFLGALQAALASAAEPSTTTPIIKNAIDRFWGAGAISVPEQPRSLEARALGKAVLENRCPYDVWIWSVDGKGSSKPIKVAKRTKYSEQIRTTCEGCGVVFKASKTNQIVNGKHTQFEYTIGGGKLWYDISFVNCAKDKSAANCPGHEKGLAMDSSNNKCGKVNCKSGSYCPTQAYYVDQPLIKLGIKEPVFDCGSAGTSMDLNMRMCSDEKALKRSVAGRLMMDEEEM